MHSGVDVASSAYLASMHSRVLIPKFSIRNFKNYSTSGMGVL